MGIGVKRSPRLTGAGTGIADHQAFERCFEELFPLVHRYIARRVGAALADDLATETFATAYRCRNNYDPARGTVRSWLYGIAANLVRNHWRAEHQLLALDARLASDMELRPDPGMSDDRLSAALAAPRIANALAQLVPDQRDVLLLHAWANLSPAENGEALGIAPGTARSCLSRARAALRRRLGSFDFDLWLFVDDPASSPQGGSHDG